MRDVDRGSDNIGMDGKLATTAIHEDCERDAGRSAEIRQLIEGGANRTPGVEDIVHDYHTPAVETPGKIGRSHNRTGTHGLQIVPVQRDVESTTREWLGRASALRYQFGDPIGELHAAPLYAHEDEIIRAAIQLHDLVGHPPQGPRHGSGVEVRGVLRCHVG